MHELSMDEVQDVSGGDLGSAITGAIVAAPLGPEASLVAFIVCYFL